MDAGIGMIDTAHLYTDGASEETLGAALSPVPEGVIVATKGIAAPSLPGATSASISRIASAPAGMAPTSQTPVPPT